MATITAGSSKTFTAQVDNSSFVVIAPGGSIGQVVDQNGNIQPIGPNGTRRTFGPLNDLQSITVSMQIGNASVELNGWSGGIPITAETNSTGQTVLDDASRAVFGNTWSVFTPPTDDYIGIEIAQSAAFVSGGGVVHLKAVTYDIGSNTIQPRNGVALVGSGYTLNTGNSVVAGTILQGDGTAPVIGHNWVDGVTPPASIPEIRSGVCYRPEVRNLAIKGGTYGIKAGALYKGGCYFGVLSGLHVEDCSEWAIWLENWQYSTIEHIYTRAASTSKGHQWYGASSNTVFNHGNLQMQELFAESGGTRTRGIVFMARGTGTAFNDVHVRKLQRNATGAKLSVAATMANGSADITVPDASQFPVDIPVTVTASVNGFTKWASYFVIYSSGTTIRVSDSMGGTAKSATGSTAVNIDTYGYPGLEVVGYGIQGANVIQPGSWTALDLEGVGTTMCVVQNANPNMDFSTMFYEQGTNLASNIVARFVSQGGFRSTAQVVPDFDSSSAAGFLSYGYIKNVAAERIGSSAPQGMVKTTTGKSGLHLGNQNNNVDVALEAVNASGQSWLHPAHSMGQRVQVSTSTSQTLNGASLGAIAFTGTSNAVWTLPTLSGTSSGATNTYIGATLEIANCSTSAGVTLTINVAAGQPFNRQAAKTSVVLALGQSFTIRAQYDGAAWFWQVVGNNGVTI